MLLYHTEAVCGLRPQLPLAMDLYSAPEPDIAVVRGSPRDYRDAHPSSAVLVIEVADATLQQDRERKGSLYARAGISDYWIVNVPDRCVEVYRDPAPAPDTAYGWAYRMKHVFATGEQVAPLASPEARIAVSDLLH